MEGRIVDPLLSGLDDLEGGRWIVGVQDANLRGYLAVEIDHQIIAAAAHFQPHVEARVFLVIEHGVLIGLAAQLVAIDLVRTQGRVEGRVEQAISVPGPFQAGRG